MSDGEGLRPELWPLPLYGAPIVSTASLIPPRQATAEPFAPQMSTDFVPQHSRISPGAVAIGEEDKFLSAMERYLNTHPHAAAELKRKEKQLRTIALHTAEGGLLGAMEKAVQALRRMYETRPAWPPHIVPADSRPPLDFHDHRFYSPLMCACEGGHVSVAKCLLDSGATVKYAGRHHPPGPDGKQQKGAGLTAMHVACLKGRENIAECLITWAREHSSLSEVINAKTIKDKWTPLMYAVKCGFVGVVRTILECTKVDILSTNGKGQTVLHIAASGSQLECLKEMHTKLPQVVNAQAKENPYLKEDKKGRNVLHRVCCGPEGSVETLQWLLEVMPHLKTAEILNLGKNASKASKGYTMLLLACDNNNVKMVRYLLSLEEVDVSACTADGKTGLHLAAIHDYPEVAQELIRHSIPLTAQDEKGDTALHIALRKSSLDVAEIIRSSEGAKGLNSIKNKANTTPDNIKAEQMIPMEIQRLGEEVVKRFLQALRKGKRKKMPRCNLIVLGEQQVGKTSLLRLLMAKEFLAILDSTRGIDNDHVDVIDMKAICSLQWQEVRPEDQAKGHEKQFINSVAQELGIPLGTKNQNGEKVQRSRPLPDALIAEIDSIIQYMEKVEELSLEPPPPQPSVMPSGGDRARVVLKKPAEATATKQPSRLNPNAPPFVPKTMNAGVSPTESKPHNPPKPPPSAEPKAKIEHARPSQPPPPTRHAQPVSPTQPTSPKQPAQPPALSATGNEQRDSSLSLRLGKSILSAAKQRPTDSEPVLQYNTLDFAGQKEYRPMHHCFIVRRALYLVVFNLQKIQEALKCPNPDKEKALEEIGYWLHSIHAHVHRIHQEPHLKRVILVGTHRAPKGEEISEEDMQNIHRALKERFVESSDIVNDLRHVSNIIFAAVESSIDGKDDTARQKSGARVVQEAIQRAWDELPFREEVYPTTWLRFEAFLNRKRESCIMKLDVIQQAAKHYGIGEEDEKEIHDALGFFHDVGTIVYLKKLPLLYIQEKDKLILDELILPDPTWLTKVMRNMMELKIGEGSTIINKEVVHLEKTGITNQSLLKECWKGVCDDNMFHPLCLILQSFCLIFPISKNGSSLAQRSASSPAASQSTAHGQDTPSELLTRSQSEGDPSSKDDTTYLIPSKLPPGDGPTEFDIAKYRITFFFDFRAFLPLEVYHRLLCLMLRDQKKDPTWTSTGTFTEKYFEIKGVQNSNWMVQKMDNKLKIFVTGSDRPTDPLEQIHEYLCKICNEKQSSLQGLKYNGGPDFVCPQCKWSGVLPCVYYPDSGQLRTKVPCQECKNCFNVNLLLDPMLRKKPQTSPLTEPQEFKPPSGLEPADASSFLCIDDLQEVREALEDIGKNWFDLGLALGLRQPTLKKIKDENNDIDDCKREMLTQWLNKLDKSKPSWMSLVHSLRNKTVKCEPIASDIEIKYLQKSI